MLESFFLLTLLIAISAFFSISEIALAASRKIKLRQLADAGHPAAHKVLALQENPGHFFTVVQIGLNAVAILGGILGEQLLAPELAIWLKVFSLPENESVSSVLAFIVVTGLFVLFADLCPKRFGMIEAERVALITVGPMQFLVGLLRPFVWLFNGLANHLFRLFGLPNVRRDDITADDIMAMADAGAQAGVLLKQEQQLIGNVFELDERTVPSAMTTRENIVFFSLEDSEEQIRQKIATNPHGKYPVCKDSIDSALGYVDAKDILPRILAGEALSLRTQPIVRNLLVIPATLTLFETLERFRDARDEFALVVSEYALVVGLITLQDVMSTVMGELASPFQEELIVRRDEDSYLIDGGTPIEDVMTALQIDVFEGFQNYETMAGFIMYSLRKVPKRTDAVFYAGYKFEVVDIDHYRIDQILATRHPGKNADVTVNTQGHSQPS